MGGFPPRMIRLFAFVNDNGELYTKIKLVGLSHDHWFVG